MYLKNTAHEICNDASTLQSVLALSHFLCLFMHTCGKIKQESILNFHISFEINVSLRSLNNIHFAILFIEAVAKIAG